MLNVFHFITENVIITVGVLRTTDEIDMHIIGIYIPGGIIDENEKEMKVFPELIAPHID